jgi:type I restriction enzyme M protein
MLRKGGRSATIVPDGVLFGSSKAHQVLRQVLVENNQLEGVFSLPAGVFRPYAGVSTAIIVFTKGGKTDRVVFCDVQSDGFSLDDKREPVGDTDLPTALAFWRNRDGNKDSDRTKQCFMVPVDEIREKEFDLSIGRYQQRVWQNVPTDKPAVIIARLKEIESAIQKDLKALEGLIS